MERTILQEIVLYIHILNYFKCMYLKGPIRNNVFSRIRVCKEFENKLPNSSYSLQPSFINSSKRLKSIPSSYLLCQHTCIPLYSSLVIPNLFATNLRPHGINPLSVSLHLSESLRIPIFFVTAYLLTR